MIKLIVYNIVLFFGIFFILLFYLLNFIISNRINIKSKVSQYECGFSRVGLVQNSFRIHFFVIMLIFIVFDLEVVMFIGVLVSDINSLFSFLLLITFIFGGFYIEW